MTLLAYFQPTFQSNHVGKKTANLTTDTLAVGLIKSTSPALAARGTSEGYEFISDLLANNGNPMTEENGTGYSRLNLTSVTYTLSGLVAKLACANPAWATATFSSTYAFFYDETDSSATDATRPLIAIWDFGGTYASTAAPFTLAISASGLVTWTAAA